MKKIVSLLMVFFTVFFSGCLPFEENQSQQAPPKSEYYVGEKQEIQGVFVKPTKVISTQNGDKWLVRIDFEIENTNENYYYLNWLHFTLNDSWTIYETSSGYTDIPSGGFDLVRGNVYEFYVSFVVKYSHEDKDMILIWSKNSYSSKSVKWVL